MQSLFEAPTFKDFGNLDLRIHWATVQSLEKDCLRILQSDSRFKEGSANERRRLIWFYWQNYLREREEFNNCSWETVTIEECMGSPINNTVDDTRSSVEDFVVYFKDQLKTFGTISHKDQIDLFSVDFDLRFFRDFEGLLPKTRKQFLALKLAIQSPKKSLETSEDFKDLVKKPDKTANDLRLIQENIDYYWEDISYDELKTIYRKCRGNEEVEVDLKISRQLDETLWFAESMNLEKEHTEIFLAVAFRLERLYRGQIRRSEFSRYAFGSNNPKEAHFNHFLRGIDLTLGMADSVMLNPQKKSSKISEQIKGFVKDSVSILELMLTTLIHDSLEDKLKTLEGKDFDKQQLASLLENSGVPSDMVDRLSKRALVLNSKAPLPSEKEKSLSYAQYIKRLQQQEDPLLNFVKIIGDISQNACSPHRMPFNPEDWTQFTSKYRAKFLATDSFIEAYVTSEIFMFFPSEILNRMRNNRQLGDGIFPQFERLFKQIDQELESELKKASSFTRKRVGEMIGNGNTFFEEPVTATQTV